MQSNQLLPSYAQISLNTLDEIKSTAKYIESCLPLGRPATFHLIKLKSLITQAIQAALSENRYNLNRSTTLAKDDLKNIELLYQLESAAKSSFLIKTFFLEICYQLLKSNLDKTDREVIFCFLTDKEITQPFLIDFMLEYFQLHAEISKYITACEIDDLTKLINLLLEKRSPAFLYKMLNAAIDQVGGFSKAIILASYFPYISDYSKELLITKRLKTTDWTDTLKLKDLSIIVATLSEKQISNFRFKTLINTPNLTNEEMSLFDSAVVAANELKLFMKTHNTDVFKAAFMKEAFNPSILIPHLQKPVLNFLKLGYEPELIKESKKLRDQIKFENDPEKIQDLIEAEADILNKIVAIDFDFKKTADHKNIKRKILGKGSIASSLVSNYNYPHAIQMIAKKTYVESEKFSKLLFLDDLNNFYKHPELKCLFDITAYAITTKPNFKILLLSDPYLKNYTKSNLRWGIGEYNLRNTICIANAETYQLSIVSILIHEIGHYLQLELHHNHCFPFKSNETDKDIQQIMRKTLQLLFRNTDRNASTILSTADLGRFYLNSILNKPIPPACMHTTSLTILGSFADEYKNKESSEIVVRYPELLTEKSLSSNIERYLWPLANYHRNVTVKKTNDFLESKQTQNEIYEAATTFIKKTINRNDVNFSKEHNDGYSLSFSSKVTFDELVTCNRLLSDANLNSTISAKNYRLNLFAQASLIYIYNSLEQIIEKLFDYKTEFTKANKTIP